MTDPQETNEDYAARKGRQIAVLIAGTGLVWILAQAVGLWLAVPQRWMALVDLGAVVAFVMALVMTYQIWRARRGN